MPPIVPTPVPTRPRTAVAALVALATLATGVLLDATPVSAALPVALRLPVPCGTVLNDTTYASHWPNPLSVDFNVPGAGNGDRGVPILAPAAGTVVALTPAQGQVELDLGSGVHVWLLHMSGISVRPGQQVAQGERIGAMDTVGRSTGVHLHLHLSVGGRFVTPEFAEGPIDYRAATTLVSGNGCAGFAAAGTGAPMAGAHAEARRYEPLAGDFDGDGTTDMALRGVADGTVFVKRGPDHDGNQAEFRWAPGANYQAVAADFDGDGFTDLALRDATDGRFFLKLGPDFRSNQVEYPWAPGANYQAFAGDVDGDGRAEIGLRDAATGTFFLKRGPHWSDNQSAYRWSPGANYRAFAGDVDGDGRAEIGLRDAADGTFFVKRGPDFDAGQSTYAWAPGANYDPFTFGGGIGLRDAADGTLFLKDGPAWSANQRTYRWAPG